MPSSTVGWWARLALHFLGLFLIVKVLRVLVWHAHYVTLAFRPKAPSRCC